jgi:hypothetical protein
MHWLFWAVLACLVFLASYNPRTGNLTKFLDFSRSETIQQAPLDSEAQSAPED